MNASTILGINIVAGAVLTAAALKLGHTKGKKDAINKLRTEQLGQAKEEYEVKMSSFKGSLDEFAEHRERLDAWLEEEERTINEMYDEILNNL